MSQKKSAQQHVLLILPGWGGSHETWADFVEEATPTFTKVLVIDLPCFGTEACPDHVWGVEDYASFVSQRIHNIRDTYPDAVLTLLGHSFGGQVAVQTVAMSPTIVDRLILSGAAVIRPKRLMRRLVFGTIAKVGKVLFRLPVIERAEVWAKKVLYRTADSPDYNHTAGIKQEIFKKIIREDKKKLLPKITVPTAVIWGTHDSYVPLRHGKQIARLLPHSTLYVIPNGRHGLHISQKPELLAHIVSFLSL